MSDQRKIYWPNRVPDELKELLSDTNTIITQQEVESESCLFRLGGQNSNLYLKPVDWEMVNTAPVAFLSESLLDWDIPKLIIKRFLAGEGGLGPEESYQGVLLKNNSLKILDANSLGYFSDILTTSAAELRINPVKVRSYCVMLLSYLDYLRKAELVSYPIDVDYGLSQDSFFIQVHCDNLGFYLENIKESTYDALVDSPFASLLAEAHKKTDLMEVYTLRSSQKLVFTACWVGNPHFIRKDFYNNLIIHQVDSFKQPKDRFGKTADVQTFHKDTLDNISKLKVVEKLPQKFTKKVSEKVDEIINPVLVNRIVKFLVSHNEDKQVDWSSLSLEQLEKEYQSFPDKDALKRLNNLEKEEILKTLIEGTSTLDEEVANVKQQIDSDDYLEGILNSLSNMSFDEAIVAADLEEEYEETSLLKGDREDLTEEAQKVAGTKEDLTEEIQIFKGLQEGLTEELQRISGAPEDLTEELQRITGSPEDLTENLKQVSGAGKIESETEVISGQQTSLAHEEKAVVRDVTDSLNEEVQVVKGQKSDLANKEKFVVKGERRDLKEDSWQLKRIEVVNKVKEKIQLLKDENADNERIDQEVKEIISSELQLDEEKSASFVKALSDDVSDDFIHEGIDSVNENIKNRIRLEKLENQLGIRDKQVEKMRKLITGLKRELANSREVKVDQASVSTSKDSTSEIADFMANVDIPVDLPSGPFDKDFEENSSALENGEEQQVEKEEVISLKSRTVELERINEKLSNDILKLQKDNELLLKKFKEGLVEGDTSSEDMSALKEKNENLESQVEKLKTRLSFLYENSKSNKEIEVSANEVQKIIEDKERYFNEKMKAQEEISFLKSEMREKERVLKQKDLEISQKSDLLKNKTVGEEEDVLKQKEEVILSLKQEVKKSNDELKATQLKTKSFEQKVKFLNAQLQKYQNDSRPKQVKAGVAATDAKVVAKLKQTEVLNAKLKESASKYQKELGEKKTELHKAKLEVKTMALKIKDLERKLLNLVKKKAA